MLTKICGKCGARYSGACCPHCEAKRQKNYDRSERNKDRAAFYKSKAWQTMTALCKARCHGIDMFELNQTGRVVMGRLSHHIIPVEDDIGRALDINNLIWVSDHSHQIIHAAYEKSEDDKQKVQDMLRKIVRGAGDLKKI